MPSSYYTHASGKPANQTRGLASEVRYELDSIAASFALLPSPTALASGSINYALDTGLTNAYVVSVSSAVTAYSDGFSFFFKPLNNNSGASTLNVNTLGLKAIVRPDGTAVQLNDIVANQILKLTYNSSYNGFQLDTDISYANQAAASASAAAISESNAAASAAATAGAIVAERSASRALTNLTGLTVVSGGASITGNSSVTGALDTTGSVSFGTTNKSNGRVSIQAGTSASGDPLFMQNMDGTNNPYLWVRQSSAGTKLYASSSSGGAASNLVLASGGVDVATVSSTGLAVTGTGSYTGNVQIASGAGTGVVAVGDAIGGTLNCGIYRGAAGTTASGDYLNIDGYAGITFSTGSAAIGSKGVKATIDASGNLQVMGPRLSIGDAGYVVLAPGGNVVLNLESLSGLATAGLLLVRGNENGLNQSIAVYSYNLSFDGGSTRYCRIIQMHRNVLNNTYGDVYAYLSNYAGSYTTADQSYSSNATSMSDIYMRNAAGAAGSANYAIIRLV